MEFVDAVKFDDVTLVLLEVLAIVIVTLVVVFVLVAFTVTFPEEFDDTVISPRGKGTLAKACFWHTRKRAKHP